MDVFWGSLMAAVGLMMVIGGATKARWIPYRFFHARASLLWKDNAHGFLMASGAIIVALGALWASGVIWN